MVKDFMDKQYRCNYPKENLEKQSCYNSFSEGKNNPLVYTDCHGLTNQANWSIFCYVKNVMVNPACCRSLLQAFPCVRPCHTNKYFKLGMDRIPGLLIVRFSGRLSNLVSGLADYPVQGLVFQLQGHKYELTGYPVNSISRPNLSRYKRDGAFMSMSLPYCQS